MIKSGAKGNWKRVLNAIYDGAPHANGRVINEKKKQQATSLARDLRMSETDFNETIFFLQDMELINVNVTIHGEAYRRDEYWTITEKGFNVIREELKLKEEGNKGAIHITISIIVAITAFFAFLLSLDAIHVGLVILFYFMFLVIPVLTCFRWIEKRKF